MKRRKRRLLRRTMSRSSGMRTVSADILADSLSKVAVETGGEEVVTVVVIS